MEDTKINNGLLAVILVASMFAGWPTVLLVAVLLLIFGKVNDNIKNVLIAIITFLAGIALFNLFWDLIVSGVGVVTNSLNDFITVLNSYLEEPINILKLNQYFLTPLTELIGIADRIVDYAIIVMKFAFIISMLTNKKMTDNFFFRKIGTYVEKFVNYLNNFGNPVPMNNNTMNNNGMQQPNMNQGYPNNMNNPQNPQ